MFSPLAGHLTVTAPRRMEAGELAGLPGIMLPGVLPAAAASRGNIYNTGSGSGRSHSWYAGRRGGRNGGRDGILVSLLAFCSSSAYQVCCRSVFVLPSGMAYW